MCVGFLPTLNAVLNATSAVLVLVGYRFIRRGQAAAHRACMLSAVAVSTLFLASYLAYHQRVGSVRFPGVGVLRGVYLSLLISHSVLAAVVPVLVVVTVYRALRGQLDRHRRLARWTLPIWLYVSVTGVLVYWMLYHLAGAQPSR